MIQILFILFNSTLLLFYSFGALAGDASHFQTLGFSPDGSYFAFAQTGLEDGSGFAYAQVVIMDVDANRPLEMKKKTSEQSSEKKALESLLKKINFKPYRIIPHTHLGEAVVSRSNTDLSHYGNTIFALSYWPEGGASAKVPKFILNLRESAAEPSETMPLCSEKTFPNDLIKLSLSGYNHPIPQNFVLFQDTSSPSGRGYCPHNYQIRHVVVFRSKLVVALQYEALGFEGPNQRFMVATADIPSWKSKTPPPKN